MRNLVSLELYKLRTTPAAWVSLAVTLVLGSGIGRVERARCQPGRAGLRFDRPRQPRALRLGAHLDGDAGGRRPHRRWGVPPPDGHADLPRRATPDPGAGGQGGDRPGFGAILGAARSASPTERPCIYGARGVHSLPVDVAQLWIGVTVATALYGLVGVALGALTPKHRRCHHRRHRLGDGHRGRHPRQPRPGRRPLAARRRVPSP